MARYRKGSIPDCLLTETSIGIAGATNLCRGGLRSKGGWFAEKVFEHILRPFHTNQDAAKMQVFVTVSKEITEKGASEGYWAPVWSWTNRFVTCEREDLVKVAKDLEGQRKLCEFSEEAIRKVDS